MNGQNNNRVKAKILFVGVVAILAAGAVIVGLWWSRRPQVVVLESGGRLTLLGTTYGRHHTPAGSRQPLPVARSRARGGPFETANDALVVWVRQEHPVNRQPQYQFYAYDKRGTACVGESTVHYNYIDETNEIVGVQFDAFPRWQRQFILEVWEPVPGQGQVLNKKRLVITNPARRDRSLPKWTAETLPATRTDGDLSVTLTKLAFGADGHFNRDEDHPGDAINKGVEAVFRVRQNGTNAVQWRPVRVETSDAAGNHQSAGCGSHWSGDEEMVDYQWGLWPDGPWKLRVEFSKESGFGDDESWTAKNIPLDAGNRQDFWRYSPARNRTNVPWAETDLNGIHLKIFRAKRFDNISPNEQPQGGFEILANPSPSDGGQMKLVRIAGNQTNDLESWNANSTSNAKMADYHFGVKNLEGVTNLDVTIAVHKNRFFEFTANPEKEINE